MRRSAPQLRRHMLLLLAAAVLCSAHTSAGQFLPLQPLQPFQPLPPMQPLMMPGFQPMQMPQFPGWPFAGAATAAGTGVGGAAAGAAAGGRGGTAGPGTFTTSSTSSFSGPRAASTAGCVVVQESSGGSFGSSSQAGSTSCSTAQRVEVCQGTGSNSSRAAAAAAANTAAAAGGATPSNSTATTTSSPFLKATATINGRDSTCCVVLLRTLDKTPQLFCAAAAGRSAGFSRMPAANTAINLVPMCTSNTPRSTAGSMACIISFAKLPEGFTYPTGFTSSKPLVLYRGIGSKASLNGTNPAAGRVSGRGFVPCGNRQFRRFMQGVSRPLPKGGVILTTKCE